MTIDAITCSGVSVRRDNGTDDIWIEETICMTPDGIYGLLEALGLLGYDLRGYTSAEVMDDDNE